MPELTNADRKKAYIDDIGKMISESTVLKQGKENPDFKNSFEEAKKYFSRQKSDDAKELATFIQHFINVFNNQQNAKNENGNEYTSQMLTDIESMRKYKAVYDRFISKSYSALKNDNVKLLSGMIQTADNIIHRTDMETRYETIGFINNQLNHEVNVMKQSSEKYKNFINDCVKNEVDFVDVDNQYKQQLQQFHKDKDTHDKLQVTYNQLNSGVINNKTDINIQERCTKELLAFDKNMNALREKTNTLGNLSVQVKLFVQDSVESIENIKRYNEQIEKDKKKIQEIDKNIIEKQAQVNAAGDARMKRDEIVSSGIITQYNECKIEYENFKENLSDFKKLAEEYPDIRKLLNNPNLGMFERMSFNFYMNAKDQLLKYNPGLEEKINQMEKDGKFLDFVKNSGKDFDIALENAQSEIKEYEKTEELQEYSKLSEIIVLGEASENNIRALYDEKADLTNDIDLNQNLIFNTKIKKGLAEEIEKAAGSLPKPPITEGGLRKFLNEKYEASKKELLEMEKSPQLDKLKKERAEAQQRIESRNIVRVKSQLDAAGAALQKSEQRLNILKGFVDRNNEIKGNTDRLVNSRIEVKNTKNSVKNVNHNKEIFDRLKSVQERFRQKSNGKMNTECQKMMTQLEKTMKLFDPEAEGTEFLHDEQKDALEKLQDLSGKYIDAKKAQRIPKFFASEQRLLRISCAEELQSFSQTAKSMVDDVKNMDRQFERANLYKNREPNDTLKSFFYDEAIRNAARDTDQLGKYNEYVQQRGMRERNNTKVETKENITVTSSLN